MTVLQRTDLTTSRKVQCAAAAVAGQHARDSKAAPSEAYGISRPTLHAAGAAAQSVLRAHFEAPLLHGAAVDVRVDDAQLRRAVVALRVPAPNAIRPIEPSSDSTSSTRRCTRCAGRWSVSTSTPVSCTVPNTSRSGSRRWRGASSRSGWGSARSSRGTCAIGAGSGAGAEGRAAPARGTGRAVVDAGGEPGVSVRVPAQGAEGPSAPCPARGAVTSSARCLRGPARPPRRCQCSVARCVGGGAAPAPSRLQCHPHSGAR